MVTRHRREVGIQVLFETVTVAVLCARGRAEQERSKRTQSHKGVFHPRAPLVEYCGKGTRFGAVWHQRAES